MSVLVKPGVEFKVIAPKGFTILAAIQRTAESFGMDLTITSATDGNHMQGSRHYSGEAFDLRTRDLANTTKEQLATELRFQLGQDFVVLIEDENGPNEHLHLQPRKV